MGCLLSILRHSNSPFQRCFPRSHSIFACSSSTSVVTALPPPIYFEGPARRQDFALPDPIMDYIAKNASSAIVYRKLVYSCKYFFLKNPMVVITCLHESKDGFYTCLIDKDGIEKFDIKKILTKLWLSNKFVKRCDLVEESDEPFTPLPPKLLIQKFYRMECAGITLDSNNFTLEEIVFFASRSAETLHLQNCIVHYENGESVQLETLLAQFPLLQSFRHTCHPDGLYISANTIKEIVSNPNFSKMKFFHLFEVPDTFDVESFYTYLKSRDDFFCLLVFRDDISDAYRERVEAIIDELLTTESTCFWFPCIIIPTLHPDTYNALKKRFYEDSKRRNYKHTSFSW